MSDRDTGYVESGDVDSDAQEDQTAKAPQVPWKTVTALMVIVACEATAARVVDLPLTRLIESRLCRRYYRQHDPSVVPPDGIVPEDLCKVDDVQSRLAWLLGAIVTITILLDMIVTLPLASVSDKRGRRLVFVLNCSGLLLMGIGFLIIGFFDLPVELAVIAPLFTVIGGSDCVFLTALFTTVADISTDTVIRGRLFSYIASVVYVSNVLSPLIAATIMSLNILVPFLIAGVLLAVALVLTRYMPGKPIGLSNAANGNVTDETALLIPELNSNTIGPAPALGEADDLCKQQSLLQGIAKRSKFRLLLGVVFLASFASSSSQLFVQYISKRYKWSIASAGILLSAKAVVNVVLLTVIVPGFIGLATRRSKGGAFVINVGAAQLCLAASVIGGLWIALAGRIEVLVAGLVVYALGSALQVFTELLVRAPEIAGSDKTSSNARDFSVAVLCKTFGSLLGTPAMTAIWAAGIHVGGAGLGLPFYATAATYAIAILLLWGLRR